MRVLVFLHSFEPGGVERDALRLNRELSRLGFDIQLVVGRSDGKLSSEQFDWPQVVLQTTRFSTAKFETLWMIAKLPSVIKRLKPDVLFCVGNTYSVVAVCMRLILGVKCPPIVLKVSNDLQRQDLPTFARNAYHLWLRFQARFFAAIVGMAEPARNEIINVMRAGADRVAIISNGSMRQSEVDLFVEARTNRHRIRAGRHYLAVGRLVKQKNFGLLLDAFALIAAQDDRLTIVGEGPERAKLERRIAHLSLSGCVALPGHVNPLMDYFAEADVFVLSSDYEGLGVVVIEALATGVPIVATNCCVNMPALLAGVGVCVPIKDPERLAVAMDSILGRPVDIRLMRERASAFTIERAAPKWQDLLSGISSSFRSESIAG